MAYGLQIWDSSGNVRLDTSDRECRYVGFFTGSVGPSSSVTVTVSGMANDGTWGLNELAYSNFYVSVSMGSGQFVISNADQYNSHDYKVQVFRI
jgi:hypothetical protein|tara:strand:- start:731 stop:1012 length:282 start_codon:yes stop_codon:yes gene_type:complete